MNAMIGLATKISELPRKSGVVLGLETALRLQGCENRLVSLPGFRKPLNFKFISYEGGI